MPHRDRDTTVHRLKATRVLVHWTQVQSDGPASNNAGRPRVTVESGQAPNGRAYTRTSYLDAQGQPLMEQ